MKLVKSPNRSKETTYGHGFKFSSLLRVSASQDGTLYVSDHNDHTIKRVTRCTTVETYAGTSGEWGWRDGDCKKALFKFPFTVLCDRRGTIYVGEETTLRKITPDGTVTTIAGGPMYGFKDGPLGESMVNGVVSMALDGEEQRLFFVDFWNYRIRYIDLRSNVVSSLKNVGRGSLYLPEPLSPAISQDNQASPDNTAGSLSFFLEPVSLAISLDGRDLYFTHYKYFERSLAVLKNYQNNYNPRTVFSELRPKDIKIRNFRLPDQPKESQFLLCLENSKLTAVSLDNPKISKSFKVCDNFAFDVKPFGNIVTIYEQISEYILSSDSLLNWPVYHLYLPSPLQIQVESFILTQCRIPREIVRLIVIYMILWFITNGLKDANFVGKWEALFPYY